MTDSQTRVLVLGSLPGEESLRLAQYYANPRNAFWRLMETVLDESLVASGYDDRLRRLLARGVGLWDSISEAVRPGSLDAAILDPTANPLAELVAGLPHVQAAAFNGAKAAAVGAGLLPAERITLLRLPSSSPAHAVPFEQKAAAWAALKPFLRSAA